MDQRAFAAFVAIAAFFLADKALALARPPIRPNSTAAAFLLSSAGVSWISPVAIRMTWTAFPITSAGRF